MKLKFDANLEYQLDAIQAVTDLFEGSTPAQNGFEISFNPQDGSLFNELGVNNRLSIDNNQILKNLHVV